MKTAIFLFTLSIFGAATTRADLKWEQTQVELHPATGDKQAIGHFKYENTGKNAVHFKSVHSSCGCTVAQSQKDQVAPGDKGEITATFNIGDRTGTQVKTVTVETDEAPGKATILTLKAVLPETLEIRPNLVFWTSSEEPKAKSIVVHPGKDFRVGSLRVNSSNPAFSTKVSRDEKSGDFRIDVTPSDTKQMSASTLTIQPDSSPKQFTALARVMNTSATQ